MHSFINIYASQAKNIISHLEIRCRKGPSNIFFFKFFLVFTCHQQFSPRSTNQIQFPSVVVVQMQTGDLYYRRWKRPDTFHAVMRIHKKQSQVPVKLANVRHSRIHVSLHKIILRFGVIVKLHCVHCMLDDVRDTLPDIHLLRVTSKDFRHEGSWCGASKGFAEPVSKSRDANNRHVQVTSECQVTGTYEYLV